MKVKATIHQIDDSYSMMVPAVEPVVNAFGKTVEQAVMRFYGDRHIYNGQFQIRRDMADGWTLSDEDRVLELYVYPGKHNLFDEIRPFEQQTFKILEAFPGAKAERTPDLIQIEIGKYGDETGVIVILAPDLLEVRFPEIKWTGPHSLISVPKKWQRLEGEELQDVSLIEFIHTAQAERRHTFQLCKYCGKSKPTGWMFRQDVCDGCAEKHLGIVH